MPAAGNTERVDPTASSRSQAVAACSARNRSSGTRLWPKLMVADLRMPPHVDEHGRGRPRRPAPARAPARPAGGRRSARQTTSSEVPWISTRRAGSVPARLVQPVDVLGHQGVEPAAALEVDQGAVPGVGLGVPHGRGESVLPRPLPHLGVREVDVEVGQLLGPGVLRPHPVGPPEVGDARVRRNARTGQHRDPLGPAHRARASANSGGLVRRNCLARPVGSLDARCGSGSGSTWRQCWHAHRPAGSGPKCRRARGTRHASSCWTRPTPRPASAAPPARYSPGAAPGGTGWPSPSVRRPT